MFDWLIAQAVHKRRATVWMALVLALVGARIAQSVKVEAFPDVTNVQVMVIALNPGQAAEEVERKVTVALERALVGIPGASMQRSITSFGLAQVIITFDDGVDIYFARQQVAERLAACELPPGVQATLGPNDTPVGQIYQYTLSSPVHTSTELRSWQEWVVAKHLSQVPGVADVVSFGGLQKEFHVLADTARMKSLGVTLPMLTQALAASNAATSGGYLRQGETEFVVRGRGFLEGPDDIADTLVKEADGAPVLVRHVAEVVESHTPRRGTVGRGQNPDAVKGSVLLRRDENPKDVLRALHRAVAQVNAQVLPEHMRIEPFYDRSRLVDTTLTTVSHNMVEGALMVTLVVWVFLRTLSGSLAVALTMPLALLAAFVGLKAVGVPANLLSMGAIDFGILLDGAVILVENVYHRLSVRRHTAEEVPELVIGAAREVVRPTLFSMAIIVAAMLPIFTLERVEGKIFRPVALTYGFALLGALCATLTVVPAVLTLILTRNPHVKAGEAPGMVALRRGYLWALGHVLRRPAAALGVGGLMLMGALALLPSLGREFLPQMNEGDLHITVTMPSTVSLTRGQAVLSEIRHDLAEFDEVQDVVTEQGHPEDGSDDEAPNQAKTFVILKPQSAWPKGQTMAKLTDAMRLKLSARPGIAYNFSQPIKDRIEEAISGVRGQVVVKIFGQDLQLMHERMGDVRRIIAETPGAQDVEIYRAGLAQHVVADINRAKAAQWGLTIDDVQHVIETSFGGQLVTEMFEHEQRVGVRVKLPTPAEGDAHTVARLMVPLASGGQVPLGSLADVHREVGRTQINREQLGRFLALKCNITGRDMGTFVDEVQHRVATKLKLPAGYYLTWGGEFDNQRRAMTQLAIVVPISVAIILVLLWATFQAWLPALVVLCGLPFAAVGGIVAMALTHTTLSVSAIIGFITLFGVATLDGVLLISYVRQSKGQEPAGLTPAMQQQRMMEAVGQRLRPVLMTALLASLGLLPAALSHAVGSDTQRPFAVVIIGGLMSATALTMLLLPSLYGLAERLAGRRERGAHR